MTNLGKMFQSQELNQVQWDYFDEGASDIVKFEGGEFLRATADHTFISIERQSDE